MGITHIAFQEFNIIQKLTVYCDTRDDKKKTGHNQELISFIRTFQIQLMCDVYFKIFLRSAVKMVTNVLERESQELTRDRR